MWMEFLVFFLFFWTILNNFKKPQNYPPGPWGLPLIGYFPLSIRSFEDKLADLKRKHDIFSWRIGSRLIIFLSDYMTVKEAFHSPIFSNRPNFEYLSLFEGNLGIISSNGKHWQNIRRFTLHHLKSLGMGKSKLLAAIQYEAIELVKIMKLQAGREAPIPNALTPAVINVLWQMVANKRYNLNDEAVIRFHELMQNAQQNLGYMMLRYIFPWINYILPEALLNFITQKHKLTQLADKLRNYFQISIDEHIESIDKTSPRDFIDEYLIEMEKQKSNPDLKMSNEDLIACINDLFGAGMETTSTTIQWAIFYLASYQEVQIKLQKEIDEALPNKTSPTFEDKLRLPYTEAFITELLRRSSITVLGVPRTVSSDITFKGYIIPKESIVMPMSEAIHLDPKHFDSPKEFKPERFLNSEGKFVNPREGFLPFGLGKRQCMGESLARMQLFIFLTAMIQHLHFYEPPNNKIDLTPSDIPLMNQPKLKQNVLINIRI